VGKAKRAHHQHSRKQWWARFALPTLQDPTVVRRSRSLWNLENQTRRRRMREQPAFGVGDTLKMKIKVKEADKVRIHPFEGTVIRKAGRGLAARCLLRVRHFRFLIGWRFFLLTDSK